MPYYAPNGKIIYSPGGGSLIKTHLTPSISCSALLGGTIAGNQTIAYGGDPSAFTSVTLASGGYGTLTYGWQYSISSSTAGSGSWTSISSSNASTYDSGVLNASTYFTRKVTDQCPSTQTAYSNVVSVTVNASTSTPFFESDFSDASISSDYSRITGTTWTNFQAKAEIDGLYIGYEGAAPEYSFADIRNDPSDANNLCLYFQNNKKYGTKTRCQGVLSFNANTIYEYRSQLKFYLHPDMQYLETSSSRFEYLSIFEIWEEHNPAWDGNAGGQAYWCLFLMKDVGVGQPMFWMCEGDYMQPAAVMDDPMWPVVHNHVVPVPYGKWATLDYTFVPGVSTAGHILITLTVDDVSTTLFDIHNHTTYPDGNSRPVSWYEPFKLYMPAAQIDYLVAGGKTCAIWYDNYKFWIKSS